MAEQREARVHKHLALEIELPVVYTADIDELREFGDPDATESEHILNCIGEPSVVTVTMESSGEKDSTVETVYGQVRGARLVEPDRGYGDGPHLTDEQLRELGQCLEPDPEEAIGRAVRSLKAAGVDAEDIADDLQHEIDRLRLAQERQPATQEATPND